MFSCSMVKVVWRAARFCRSCGLRHKLSVICMLKPLGSDAKCCSYSVCYKRAAGCELQASRWSVRNLCICHSEYLSEVGAVFLCPSWNRIKFLVLFGQIGSREGSFGVEIRRMALWTSEEKSEVILFSCCMCFGLHTAPWFCSAVPHFHSGECSCAPGLEAVMDTRYITLGRNVARGEMRKSELWVLCRTLPFKGVGLKQPRALSSTA